MVGRLLNPLQSNRGYLLAQAQAADFIHETRIEAVELVTEGSLVSLDRMQQLEVRRPSSIRRCLSCTQNQ